FSRHATERQAAAALLLDGRVGPAIGVGRAPACDYGIGGDGRSGGGKPCQGKPRGDRERVKRSSRPAARCVGTDERDCRLVERPWKGTEDGIGRPDHRSGTLRRAARVCRSHRRVPAPDNGQGSSIGTPSRRARAASQWRRRASAEDDRMTQSAPISSASSDLRSSAALLTGMNIVCAVVGVSQGLFVLRLLGPEIFGAAAVVVALTSVATNLVDVRLIDLISSLYYNEKASCPDTGSAYRTSALRLGFRLYVLSAALIAVASAGVMFVVAQRLTGVHLMTSWLWMAAAAQGVSYLGSFFIFIQRFAVLPRRM